MHKFYNFYNFRVAGSTDLSNEFVEDNIVDVLFLLDQIQEVVHLFKSINIIELRRSFTMVNQLLAEVASVSARLVLQLIPGHCHIKVNEQADSLAKEGGAMNQIEMDMSLEESKSQIRTAIYQRWIENHPNYSKAYAYYRLNREGQTIIFSLCSGHNHLKKNTCMQNSKLVQAPTVHVAISLKQLSTSSRIAHFMQN